MTENPSTLKRPDRKKVQNQQKPLTESNDLLRPSGGTFKSSASLKFQRRLETQPNTFSSGCSPKSCVPEMLSSLTDCYKSIRLIKFHITGWGVLLKEWLAETITLLFCFQIQKQTQEKKKKTRQTILSVSAPGLYLFIQQLLMCLDTLCARSWQTYCCHRRSERGKHRSNLSLTHTRTE